MCSMGDKLFIFSGGEQGCANYDLQNANSQIEMLEMSVLKTKQMYTWQLIQTKTEMAPRFGLAAIQISE